MATGLKIPVGVNKRGGTAMVTNDEHSDQLIATALSDNSSTHAYQQEEGLGIDMIFQPMEQSARARIIFRVRSIFKQFEGLDLFKLKEDTIKWKEHPETQELELQFKYINLESDEEKTFNTRLQGQTI